MQLTSASRAADDPGAMVTSKPTGEGCNVAGWCRRTINSYAHC